MKKLKKIFKKVLVYFGISKKAEKTDKEISHDNYTLW